MTLCVEYPHSQSIRNINDIHIHKNANRKKTDEDNWKNIYTYDFFYEENWEKKLSELNTYVYASY